MIVWEKKNAERIIPKPKFNKNLSIFLCDMYRKIIISGVISPILLKGESTYA